MKHEIEAKIKVDSLAPYEALLKNLGAAGGSPIREIDTYYASRTHTSIGSDCALRLRKVLHPDGEKYILTYKGPRSSSLFKSRPEAQTELADYQAAQSILSALGLTAQLTFEKMRSVWTLDKCEICLDDVPPLGQFVEIEGPDEAAINAILSKLHLDGKYHISEGYSKMMAQLMNECKQKNSSARPNL